MPSNSSQTPGPQRYKTDIPPRLTLVGVVLAVVVVLIVAAGTFAVVQSGFDPVAEPTPTALRALPTGILSTATIEAAVNKTETPTAIVPPTATLDPARPLAGRRIGLDPGHGPREDLGAVYLDGDTGKVALTEAEFNLDVALRCRDLLVARGADVVVTREENDTFIIPWPNDANGDGTEGASGDELQSRIDIINDFGAEVFLSIHGNSASEPGNGDDLQVLYCGADDCAFAAENKRLSKIVLAHLDSSLASAGINVDGGSTMDDLTIDGTGLHLFMLGPARAPRHPRAIEMPGVLGETLYITLPSSARLLMREDVRQIIAQAYADALQEYLTE